MKFCKRPFSYVYLARDGEVWPCSWMHCTLGNLYHQDFMSIWNSDAAEMARKSILDGSFVYCRKTSCPFLERDDLPDLSEEEIQEQAVVSHTPETIFVANDLICNIACTKCRTAMFCPDEEYRTKIDNGLKQILPYANRAKRLNLNGAGEFLANPSFLKFLNALRPEHKDYHISFETNGVLFDESHWTQFSHLGEYNISVTLTLDSLHAETYRYLSGGFDKVEQVKRNIQFLSRLRRENKINEFVITMVVQECNYQELPDYIRTFSDSEIYTVDKILLRPIYKWFRMDEETYWFKNILNPLHPYHSDYCRILEDDCWKNPKVYDWGCHNLREPMQHPLAQEKIYNRLLLDIYQNEQGFSPTDYINFCLRRTGGTHVGFFGKNEFSQAIIKLMKAAGVNVVLQLTWAEDEKGEIPKVSKQNFQPDMVDVMLIIDFHKGGYWFKDLPVLGFTGPILTIEEFIEGKQE